MYSRERYMEPSKLAIEQKPRRPFQRRRHRSPTDNPDYVSLEHVCDQYLLHLERSKKTASWKTTKHQFNPILKYFGPDLDVTLLRPPAIDLYKQQERQRCAPETVNNRLGALRAALNWCAKIGVLTSVPCQIETLRVGRKRRRILTKEEVGTLIKYARPPFNLIIRIAAFAGLRHQEILHLTREDIDFIDGKIWVTAKNEPHLNWSPKRYHERAIPMPRTELESHLVNWLDRGAGENWLFPGLEPGHPRKDVIKPIRRIFKTADLHDPKIRPGLHALRRHWATSLCRVTDVETLRQLGGWNNITTVQAYLGSDENAKRSAIDLL